MRWKAKKKERPKEGDRRIMEQILLFPKCLDGEWKELKTNTLKEWLTKKHPATLKMWEDHFSDLIDLDMWLEEYHGWLDQKFQACLEREE